MRNKVDDLVSDVYERIQTGDGSPDSQNRINEAVFDALREITRILKTCERDLR